MLSKYCPHSVSFSLSFSLGDEFASTFLIRHSAQVNAATVGAVETPLHLVCSFSPKKHSGEVMAGMAHIAEALLKAGANPNMQNSKGRWVIKFKGFFCNKSFGIISAIMFFGSKAYSLYS